MKLSGLQLSGGLSLVFHAVAVGIYAFCGDAWPQAESPSSDVALTIHLVAAPDESNVQFATVAPVAVVAPSIETPKPVPQRETPPEPLPVESVSAAVITRPNLNLVPQPSATPIAAADATVPPMPPSQVSLRDGSSQPSGGVRPGVQAQSGHQALPDYRRNPKPVYPLAARRRRQEGLVLLSVKVSDQGFAARVTVKQSSGFTLLDEAALQTVRDWEFEPARIGTLAVESEIQVPVRFRLGD